MKLQKSSDTEFVDLAELAMSDLDESDTVFEGFSQFDCNSDGAILNLQQISISKLQAAPRTLLNLNIKKIKIFYHQNNLLKNPFQ